MEFVKEWEEGKEYECRKKIAAELDEKRCATLKRLRKASKIAWALCPALAVAGLVGTAILGAPVVMFVGAICGVVSGGVGYSLDEDAYEKSFAINKYGDAVTKEMKKNPAKYGITPANAEPKTAPFASLTTSIRRAFAAASKRGGKDAVSTPTADSPVPTYPAARI